MIGIISGESFTAIELQPVFAKRCPRWLRLVLPFSLPDKCWGEWGVAFNGFKQICLFKRYEMRFIQIGVKGSER